MKKSELIAALKDIPEDMEVLVPAWHGSTGRGSSLIHCQVVSAHEDNFIPMQRSEDKVSYKPVEPTEDKELYRKVILLHGDDERRIRNRSRRVANANKDQLNQL